MGECILLNNKSILYRRCLADVKLMAAGKEDEYIAKDSQWLDQVMLENTDLIDGVYEGGFKTWECSLDLANYLSECDDSIFVNKRVLELGCGSALPGSHVDFQDYNELVIKLVTMPNTLINTLSKPETNEIDSKGLFEVDVDLKALDNLHASFYSGDWATLNENGTEQYDVILTSETIYSCETHQKLHDVMKRSLRPNGNM
ncbi:hypothetical protein HK100_006119 [Physocladia obscura]|uniref:protein-histidine N-methyltransferase n=1 Tax=Physocladia obscura TaxID=109957 RepID=A0AAD5XCT9_9FUNG|nr:hypothetical protein HK100_006119 [Physocladia obscura]